MLPETKIQRQNYNFILVRLVWLNPCVIIEMAEWACQHKSQVKSFIMNRKFHGSQCMPSPQGNINQNEQQMYDTSTEERRLTRVWITNYKGL